MRAVIAPVSAELRPEHAPSPPAMRRCRSVLRMTSGMTAECAGDGMLEVSRQREPALVRVLVPAGPPSGLPVGPRPIRENHMPLRLAPFLLVALAAVPVLHAASAGPSRHFTGADQTGVSDQTGVRSCIITW